MNPLRPLALSLAIAACAPGHAEALTRAFGHDVSIGSSERFGPQVLKVDGRAVLSEGTISLDEAATVGGTGVVVGYASSAGTACGGSAFVLSFPEGGLPRVDGPPGACGAQATIRDGRLTLATPARADRDGESWTWEPGRGLVPGPRVTRTALPGSGWDRIRERAVDHPSRLLDYADTAEAIRAAAGDRLPEVGRLLSGTGSGQVDGTVFSAETCPPGRCLGTGLALFADLPTRKVYLAWIGEDGRYAASPATGEWPPHLQAQARAWSDRTLGR